MSPLGAPPLSPSPFVLFLLFLFRCPSMSLQSGVLFQTPLSLIFYPKVNAKLIALTTAAADEHPAEAASNPKGCLETAQLKIRQRMTLKSTRCIKKSLALSLLASLLPWPLTLFPCRLLFLAISVCGEQMAQQPKRTMHSSRQGS